MASSLSPLAGQTLTWAPRAINGPYNLITPEQTNLATLDMSSWTTKAQASVPEGTLFLRKEGLLSLKVIISMDEQDPPIATYQRKWTGTSGHLLFPDGRDFLWDRTNFWGTQRAWTDAPGTTAYIQFVTRRFSFSRTSTVVILPQAAAIPELSLLLVLGLYNILIERRNAAVATSAASA